MALKIETNYKGDIDKLLEGDILPKIVRNAENGCMEGIVYDEAGNRVGTYSLKQKGES